MCDTSPRSPSQYRSLAANSSHLAFSSAKLPEAATPVHMRSLNSPSLMAERAMPTMLNVAGRRPLSQRLKRAGSSFRDVRSPEAPIMTMLVVSPNMGRVSRAPAVHEAVLLGSDVGEQVVV